MNLIEFLKIAKIDELDLPSPINYLLNAQSIDTFRKLYISIQSFRAIGKHTIKGLTDEDMQIINKKVLDLMVKNGVMKSAKTSTPQSTITSTSSTIVTNNRQKPNNSKNPTSSSARKAVRNKEPETGMIKHVVKKDLPPEPLPDSPPSPITALELRFSLELRKVELVGEIPLSKEELDDISGHFNRLFYNHNSDDVLNLIERNYPATFLVFMVGQGIYGYNDGDFWSTYGQILNKHVDSTAFGRLFEKLIRRFNKPQFKDLQERARRYVDPILAHGGIPVYCLKDFFSNIVLNCANHPQLFALEGEELIDEVIKHNSYTNNTDKPVLNFLEYGGTTAANLLDRARKMLLIWQQNQNLLSAEDAGLPVHITQFFAEWTSENAELSHKSGPRSKLKRPHLSLDPWGLGIFLDLPSQPISALNTSDLYWKIEAGNYHEEIKARTLRKGDHLETRELTLRLNEVTEKITVRFSQCGNEIEWIINGYSPNHLILAFDPTTGYLQNNILARETWLLFPQHLSISVIEGEGNLLEILPDLPGEWSKLNLECWDLTQTTRIGLLQQNELFREIYIRNQEKIEQPSLLGGTIVSTDLEENPIPLYSGAPPTLRIPLGRAEDIYNELNRWQIKLENSSLADPEVSLQLTLSDISNIDCEIIGNTALIHLASSNMLTSKPAGIYQITIKGPLGRDANFSLQFLPECEVFGLRELNIPDRYLGPKPVSFSIHTSLLAGVDNLTSSNGIKINTEKPGLHQILVPPEVNSVGLLFRLETDLNKFIRIPIYFRVKRLRWRIVGDNGLIENWLQKHATLSLQELLQEETPLLIVDLPGNEKGDLKIELNLLDVQGKIIQNIKPTERSMNHITRFWRFDLSKIKHTMQMNDTPIFRLDIVGIKDEMGEPEFNLPALVYNREIQINNFQSEVNSSSSQHHILVTWNETKHLRSRALVLWSLFRPWQLPIVENIPDSACGEYEFSIFRNDHAEGMYRLQMVIIDPWAPTPPSTLPPMSGIAGCIDIEISSSEDRLQILNNELSVTSNRQIIQFGDRIEISLIKHHLGEIPASIQDLEVCCCNLISATSREILTLHSMLEIIGSSQLEKEFWGQLIQAEIIDHLYRDMETSEITFFEFNSLLTFSPNSKYWPVQTCEILVKIEDPIIRFKALIQLVSQNIAKAVSWIIILSQQSKLSIEDAVELIYEEKFAAVEHLRKYKDDPIVEQLLDLLNRYNPYSGLPVIRIGSWVLTNAGWGRIEEIVDPSTMTSVDSFLEGEGKYILSVALHIYECHDLIGENAQINMEKGKISFRKARQLFICKHCQEFVTSKIELFKKHLATVHENALPNPGEPGDFVILTKTQFNLNPQQKKRE